MNYKYTDKEVILFDHILDLVGGNDDYRCSTQSIFKKLIPLEVQRKTWGHEQNRIKVRLTQALERMIDDGHLELSTDKQTIGLTAGQGLAFYERGGYAGDRDRSVKEGTLEERKTLGSRQFDERELLELRSRVEHLERRVKKNARLILSLLALVIFLSVFILLRL